MSMETIDRFCRLDDEFIWDVGSLVGDERELASDKETSLIFGRRLV